MRVKKKTVGAKRSIRRKKSTVLIIKDRNGLKPYIELAKKNGGSFNIIDDESVEDALMVGIIEKGISSGKGSLERVKKMLRGEA